MKSTILNQRSACRDNMCVSVEQWKTIDCFGYIEDYTLPSYVDDIKPLLDKDPLVVVYE